MGTRNLTVVIYNDKIKVAQYGQWDGYPEGQGRTILKFLHAMMQEEFVEVLKHVRFMQDDDREVLQAYLTSIGAKDGWCTLEQAKLLDEKYPLLNRDVGGFILALICQQTAQEIILENAYTFAADSLFCEWAYVIDLDTNVFEVYKGFNKKKLSKKDRFYSLQKDKDVNNGYYPVKMVKSYPLKNLPRVKFFLNDLENQ